MYEATFRIDDRGSHPVQTAGTGCRVDLWCNEHCDLLHVRGGDVERVVGRLREDVGVDESLEAEGEAVAVTAACLRERESAPVERYLRRHGCLLLPPLRFENGEKHCRLLALDPAALTGVYRDLVDDGFAVDVASKREVEAVGQRGPLLFPDGVVPDLTDRQRTALLAAYELGYYEIPRETTTEDIAAAVGVERRTAEDHLRRAERKLVGALAPYLGG